MKKSAKIYGKSRDVNKIDTGVPAQLNDRFELKEYIEVSSSRAINEENVVQFEEDDLLALQFTDDTEWIGHPEDIQEIYNKKTLEKRSIIEEDYLFDAQIGTTESSRGFIDRAVVKIFRVFTSKKKEVASIAVTELGKRYDAKVQPNPGLFSIDKNFRKSSSTDIESSKPHLLLLHGTLSTVEDAFTGFEDTKSWDEISARYSGRMLAFEHYTLSESPLQNVINFLNACPSNVILDIISHSRGGLIADILAKCDASHSEIQTIGFTENELSILENADPASYKLMLKINELAEEKHLTIRKVIRVAAPSSGTTILSERVDHFFNLVLNAVSLAFGIRNPLYEVVKSFLLEIISQKDDPLVLPGLNSMVPDSPFQKMLNAADTSVSSELYTVSGDAEIGGLNFGSLKVILANLFYRGANDLVVDTHRMIHGIPRDNGYYSFLSQDKNTNHFNYFKNPNTGEAIAQAIAATAHTPASLFKKEVYAEGQRGVLLDKLSLNGTNYEPKELKRDAVILIPGIMGSTLKNDSEELWVQMRALNKGAITESLPINTSGVEASGVITKYYGKMADYLSKDYDVYTLAFDWRKSVKEAAKDLERRITEIIEAGKGKIHIVAHSMGGLVARQCMMDHKDTWTRFNSNDDNKFVMLGTPWLGSYLIMETLTGHGKRLKQIAAIDFRSNRKDLLEIFWKYPGIFELLPIETGSFRNFGTAKFWKDIQSRINSKHIPSITENQSSLTEFNDFRKSVLNFLNEIDRKKSEGYFDNIYYICGKADQTVFDYKYKSRFLSRHDKLVYQATNEGDGSVTWKTGIPEQLVGSSNLYYTNITHGQLSNDPSLFDGLSEILKNGKTNKLATQPPLSRSGEIITEIHEYAEPLSNSKGVIDAIFDTKESSALPAEEINVTVVNGDLQASRFPVMVGHFFMDLILSAEKALDNYLENRLSQRMEIGYYPGKIGESEVFFNLNTQPKGAIVCGLGTTDTLTSFLLSKTIKLAILKYAMFMRDNYTLPKAKKYASGVSFMLIGIGYGKLPIEDSLKGILLGLAAANEYIRGDGASLSLQPIKDVEIVNYYESISSQAYYSLNRLKDIDNRISINLNKKVVRRMGVKKKQLISDSIYKWWYNLQIKCIEGSDGKTGLSYYSSVGLARIEEEMVGIGMHKIYHLLESFSTSSSYDSNLSKTLFEMLIPNDFKNVFRNQGNMIIKLDKKAAEIPWELLYDPDTDVTPVSVSSTFIRQLVTQDATKFTNVSLGNKEVLVIGDPLYGDKKLQPLPAARAEAEWVATQLDRERYNISSLFGATASTIMMELYSKKYKLMHFAGHGLYEEDGDIGIAIGNGICIDPAMINQLGYVPEFVFINCCFSGTINAEDDKASRSRYKLAANVGTQLIEMGVKAIIISGWAVDDAAARTFSETFYEQMLDGHDFGTAVQKARLCCFQNHPQTNTWGAYQCYGNQYYKLNNRRKKKKKSLDYLIPSQIYTDLDNLLMSIQDRKSNVDKTLGKLDHYLDKAEKANLIDAIVLEKEALIYDELGKSEIALQKYIELFKYANGNFSIEALEQYCVIKSFQLEKSTLKKDLEQIEFLTMVGENPSRLNIVGNANKFASTKVTAKTQQIRYLKKAFGFYEKSFNTARSDRFDGDYLDALTNMIFIGHILELKGEQSLLERLKTCDAFAEVPDIEQYLLEFEKELEAYDTSDTDISVEIGIVETQYCLLLLKKDFDADAEGNIVKRFKHIFQLRYSPRYINTEQQQIDFLLAHITDDKIRKQLILIRSEIEKLR